MLEKRRNLIDLEYIYFFLNHGRRNVFSYKILSLIKKATCSRAIVVRDGVKVGQFGHTTHTTPNLFLILRHLERRKL